MKKSGCLAALLLLSLIGAARIEAASRAAAGSPAKTTDTAPTLGALASSGQIKIDTVGTGETIGHVADLKIENLTDQPINCVVGPMVLESKSRKNQDYVCAKLQTAKIEPHGTRTVPLDGVCINRNKPPVGKGAPGDLVVNTGDPTIPQNPDSHVPANQARDLLRICTSKYDAAEKLQKDGALRDLPYKDKQKQKDIVVQWSTWCDPRISQITGAPPATKEDLRKVVYKQVEEKGPMSPETKKKVDQGIDTIFEKVELTTAKAKDLEKRVLLAPPPPAPEETAMQPPPPTPAPTPTPTPTPTPKRKHRDEIDMSDWSHWMGQPPPRPTPAATPTATATPTLAPNMQALQDCLDAAKKKKKECEDAATKRSDACLDKCKKETNDIGRGICVLGCANQLLGDIAVCNANYAEALEDCIKKHLAEGQK